MRPLIGIPCHSGLRAETARPIYCNNRAYVHAVEHAGGVPILIPLFDNINILGSLLSRLDGLLLPGGLDMQPLHYCEEPHPLLGEVDPQIDELELALARWALEEDVPTLGICRGMQLLNVALSGTLYQDLGAQYPDSITHMYGDLPRGQVTHRVYVESGSQMEKTLGASEVWVNSLHHQAIKKPGRGVRVTGRAEDGVAELIEVADYRFVMAAQGHPEELYTHQPAWAHLFSALIDACTDRVIVQEGIAAIGVA
jgi:putative glutamine amidotransferase